MTTKEILNTYKMKKELVEREQNKMYNIRNEYVTNYAGNGELKGKGWCRFYCNGYVFEINRYDVDIADIKPEGCQGIPHTTEEFIKMKSDIDEAKKSATRAYMALCYIERG